MNGCHLLKGASYTREGHKCSMIKENNHVNQVTLPRNMQALRRFMTGSVAYDIDLFGAAQIVTTSTGIRNFLGSS